MSMLIAGSDVSGNKTGEERRIIALVIGTEDSINSLHNKIGLAEIHMSELKKNKRNHVLNNLDFQNKERFAISLEVEKNKTVHEIHEYMKKQEPLYDIGVIFQHFDLLLLDRIRKTIENIIVNYGMVIKDLSVQCEGDMLATIRAWNMKISDKGKGKAYELSDAIAWACNADKNIKGVIKKNLVHDLRNQMRKDFR